MYKFNPFTGKLDNINPSGSIGGAVEGTAVLSTGEAGGTKFLREDGDGTCSWQTVSTGSYVATDHGTLTGLTDLDHPASAIINTPAGNIAATDVQLAINELDSEKAPIASPVFTTQITTPVVYGSSVANGDITIEGTSDATKTTSYVILQPTVGNVGIGTTTPEAPLNVIGSAFPALEVIRTTTATDSFNSGIELITRSSGDVTDGFGGGLVFALQDTGVTTNTCFLAGIGAVRAGSDNTGDFIVRTYLSGVPAERMRIKSSGNVGIGISPVTKLHIAGTSENISSTYYGIMKIDTDSGTNDTGFKMGALAGAGTAGYGFIQAVHTNVANDGNLILNPSGGNIGLGVTAPTAYLHIKAGTATARTAPIKLTAGVSNTAPEAGAIEFDGTDYFISI